MTTPAFVLAQRRSLLWRIHFWAALIASPFALVAALTGLLFVFTPQIEAAMYGELDTVAPAGERRPLDAIVQAARNAAPAGMELRRVVVPARADESVQVAFSPVRAGAAGMPAAGGHEGHGGHAAPAAAEAPAAVDAHAAHAGHPGHEAHAASEGHAAHAAHAGQAAPATPVVPPAAATPAGPAPSVWGDRLPRGAVVYVDPYSARVLGTLPEMERFNVWARRLHSSLLQSDGWRWMIELAASWLMVMLLSGVYLWWPRGKARALPETGARGRAWWKQWHAFAGVALSVMSLAILTTGLTWSRYAGDQIRAARDAIGQAPPSAPRGLKSIATEGRPQSWEAVLQATRRQAPDVAIQMLPPHGAQGVWRLNNVDRGVVGGRFSMVLDAYSGRTLFLAGWDRQTLFSKATAVGIPFHRGEFGWWNQALLFLFGAGVLFSLVSGWVMFFMRRRQGAATLPRLLPGAWTSLPVAGWVATGVLLVAMPLLALSAPLVALLEVLLHRQRAGQFAVIEG